MENRKSKNLEKSESIYFPEIAVLSFKLEEESENPPAEPSLPAAVHTSGCPFPEQRSAC